MIITDEEFLRQPCVDVLPEEIGPLKDQLERELAYSEKIGNPGIGLAAIQIGVLKNMAIVRVGKGLDFDLVNCKIKQGYDPIFFEEGCLSYPGRIEKTKRYQEVHVVDNLVGPNNFVATGLLAIVCQHEIDHMNNILLPDIAIKEKSTGKNKIRPNDPCICGKPIKYKKCCGKFK